LIHARVSDFAKENADFTGIPARAQVGRTLHAPTAVQAHE
jgi:hypothetical protein